MFVVSIPEYVQIAIIFMTYAGSRVQSATVHIVQQQWHHIPMVLVLNHISEHMALLLVLRCTLQ